MGTVDRRPLGYTAGHIAVPGTRVVFTATFALMILDLADRQVVVATFPQLQAEWGCRTRNSALVSVVWVTVGLGAFPAALLVDRWSRVRAIAVMGTVWSLAARRGGRGAELWSAPHGPRRSGRRRGRLRSGCRGTPGDEVPACPASDRPRSVPVSGASGRDAGCGPRRCGRGAVGVARGVLGPRAPRAGRGPVVPPLPGLSDGAAGRRDRRPLGAARGARAVSVPVWVSRIRGRGCPAGGGIDDLHVAPQPAAPRLRYAGRPGVWPPRWSSSPGSPA
jgi:hypothetical protein